MHNIDGVTPRDQYRALGLSTLAFTVCFAVWTIFSIIGVKIKQDLGLTETQFGLLVATPILTGSLSRIFLGVWTDQFGGRIMLPLQMLITAISVWLLASVQTYAVFLMIAGPWISWRVVHYRHRLCVALVRSGTAGHGAGHFRSR